MEVQEKCHNYNILVNVIVRSTLSKDQLIKERVSISKYLFNQPHRLDEGCKLTYFYNINSLPKWP